MMGRRGIRFGRSAAVLPLLLVVASLTACRPASETLDWAAVQDRIDRQHPDVPSITTDALAELLERGDRPLLLLDARSSPEYDTSHLRGAQHAETAPEAVGLVEAAPPGALIVAYCSVGYRSAALVEALRARGIADAVNLTGSIFAWANEGRPVYRGRDVVDVVHPFDASWGTLLDENRWPESWTPR